MTYRNIGNKSYKTSWVELSQSSQIHSLPQIHRNNHQPLLPTCPVSPPKLFPQNPTFIQASTNSYPSSNTHTHQTHRTHPIQTCSLLQTCPVQPESTSLMQPSVAKLVSNMPSPASTIPSSKHTQTGLPNPTLISSSKHAQSQILPS